MLGQAGTTFLFFQPIRKKDLLVTLGVSVAYLLLSKLLIGFRSEQLFLVILFNVLYYLSVPTRKFIIGFSIFIVYWIVFDYMKAFPNYQFSTVHIEGLYEAEKSVFGIHLGGGVLTPNEYWLGHTTHFLDVLTGLFYLCWVPVPMGFACYLFFKDRKQFIHFALTFFLVNLLGFVVYYTYPAAPPWYVQQHGFQFIEGTPGNTAGLHRFDDFFHIHIFQSIYAKGSNVFAAMPSLHSSYPVIVVFYALKNKLGWANGLFMLVMVGIWFSAVYNSHHYVLDVLAGIACACLGIWIFQKVVVPNRSYVQFQRGMLRLIR